MPEKPPMMPTPEGPKPEKPFEELSVDELQAQIEALNREIDDLNERLKSIKEPKRASESEGGIFDKDTALGSDEKRPPRRVRSKERDQVIGKDLELEISRKMRERARRQMRQMELLPKGSKEEN